MYHFSQFTIELNEMEQGVAPTDSRHRPDMRLMEEGNLEQADKIKHSLEVKYISKKKTEPIWFEMKTNPITNETFYHFKNDDQTQNYWECKKRNDWSRTSSSLFSH
jgi:hypothetical protein